MADTDETKPKGPDWHRGLIIGLAIGVALPTAQGVTHAFEASLGYWWALLAGFVAACMVAGLLALLVDWLLWARKRSRATGKPDADRPCDGTN